MKNRVKVFINNKPRQIIKSVVERNGTRAIDTATIVIPRQTPVTKGDHVSYIQDPVDTTSLVGIWNFFDNTRDESGYDIDADESTNNDFTGGYKDGCDGRVAVFNGSSTTRPVKILHKESASNFPYIDFSGQFDIIIWASVFGASSPAGYFFSKGNATDYIKISHTAVSSSTSRAKVEIKIDNGTPVVLTGTNVNLFSSNVSASGGSDHIDSSEYHFIRVKRDGDNLVSLIVDGTTEATATASGIIDTNDGGDTLLYIGGDVDGSSHPSCLMAQVRFYSGGYLKDEDYSELRSSRRQPLTMKFGGKIWKVEEKPTHKKIYAKGLAKFLQEVEVQRSDATVSWTTDTTGVAPYINKNIFAEKNGAEIITELLRVYDSEYKVLDIHGNMNTDYVKYTASGTIFTNLLICVINGKGDSSFSVAPRKILRLEDNDIDYHSGGATIESNGTISSSWLSSSWHKKFSPITFKQGVVRIKDLGFDETNTVTQITAIGNIPTKRSVKVNASGNFETVTENGSTLYKLSSGSYAFDNRNAFETRAWRNTNDYGIGGTEMTEVFGTPSTASSTYEFRVDYLQKQIYLGFSPSGNITTKYYWEDINTDNYKVVKGGDSVLTGQRRSKTLFVPQLTTAGDGQSNGTLNVMQFASRYLTRFGTLSRRFSLKAPTLLNHIRENYKVNVIDSTHGQSTATAVPIKTVKYLYPEGITEVDLGNHTLDSFDIGNAISNKTSELRSRMTKTEPY